MLVEGNSDTLEVAIPPPFCKVRKYQVLQPAHYSTDSSLTKANTVANFPEFHNIWVGFLEEKWRTSRCDGFSRSLIRDWLKEKECDWLVEWSLVAAGGAWRVNPSGLFGVWFIVWFIAGLTD